MGLDQDSGRDARQVLVISLSNLNFGEPWLRQHWAFSDSNGVTFFVVHGNALLAGWCLMKAKEQGVEVYEARSCPRADSDKYDRYDGWETQSLLSLGGFDERVRRGKCEYESGCWSKSHCLISIYLRHIRH